MRCDPTLPIWIYTGTGAWREAKAKPSNTLVLPDGECPDLFTWPVAGYQVLIVRTSALDSETLLSLARALLRARAKSVTAINSGPLVDFIPEVSDAVT